MVRRIIRQKGKNELASGEKANISQPAPLLPSKEETAGLAVKVDLFVKQGVEPDRSNEPRHDEAFGTEFLDNLAHQMVAPLQSVQMHCRNLLQGSVPNEKKVARLREVIGHATILADLARRMRFLHELVSGKEILNEQIEFDSVVTNWIDCYNNYLPFLEPRGVTAHIATNKMNVLPPVVGSPLAAHQVIMNLYDNALKYGAPNSTIMIRATRDGEFIVNDFEHVAGINLTQEAASKMFEIRGYRAEEAKKLSGSGTGIGMWISRRLMKSMQGDLQVRPTDTNKITKFRVIWRVAR